MTLFISVDAVVIFRGPLGKGLGERLAGSKLEGNALPETEALHAEVDELRYRVTEMEERLDFAERMLAKQPGPPQLQADNE
jgi:hypothetical protein